MPEGLNFVEVHTEAAEHAEHEEHAKHGHREETGWTKWVAIGEAVLLSVVTITVAWSGFAAAKWNTEANQILSQSALTGVQASRADLDAQLLRDFDASTFDAWFTAYVAEKPDKMAIAERRFRPVMKAAFDAWLATNPETNANAPKGPTYMAEYVLVEEDEAKALAAEAQQLHEEGVEAGFTGDEYVRSTVVLAGVLFLMGIGRTFPTASVRLGLITVGIGLLGVALALILQLPAPPA